MTEYAVGDRVKLARGPESKNTWPDDVPDVCYGDYVGRVAQNEVYPHRVRISNGTNRVFRDTEVSSAFLYPYGAPLGTGIHAEITPGDTARNESIIRASLRDPENPETLIA